MRVREREKERERLTNLLVFSLKLYSSKFDICKSNIGLFDSKKQFAPPENSA